MISESKVIIFPLKGRYLRVTVSKVSRCGIMATQLLATLTTVHHLLRCGIVVYLVNPRHLFHSIPLEVCFVSQLERCCYVPFRELILSCSILEKINSSRVFLPLVVMIAGVLKARLRDNDGGWINVHLKCNWIVKIVLVCVPPSPYPTLESRDEIFV